jgi:hypothetical protein
MPNSAYSINQLSKAQTPRANCQSNKCMCVCVSAIGDDPESEVKSDAGHGKRLTGTNLMALH